MMVSRVKPLHAKVEQTTQAIDNAEHKMMILENKRKVSVTHSQRHHCQVCQSQDTHSMM